MGTLANIGQHDGMELQRERELLRTIDRIQNAITAAEFIPKSKNKQIGKSVVARLEALKHELEGELGY